MEISPQNKGLTNHRMSLHGQTSLRVYQEWGCITLSFWEYQSQLMQKIVASELFILTFGPKYVQQFPFLSAMHLIHY